MHNKTLVFVISLWLTGFVAGAIFVSRWRLMGENQLLASATAATPEPVANVQSSSPAGRVRRTTQRFAGPILAGAKADLVTARKATRHVTRRVTSKIAAGDALPMS